MRIDGLTSEAGAKRLPAVAHAETLDFFAGTSAEGCESGIRRQPEFVSGDETVRTEWRSKEVWSVGAPRRQAEARRLRNDYFVKVADGALAVEPPGPTVTTTA